jgi:hypothetical protein
MNFPPLYLLLLLLSHDKAGVRCLVGLVSGTLSDISWIGGQRAWVTLSPRSRIVSFFSFLLHYKIKDYTLSHSTATYMHSKLCFCWHHHSLLQTSVDWFGLQVLQSFTPSRQSGALSWPGDDDDAGDTLESKSDNVQFMYSFVCGETMVIDDGTFMTGSIFNMCTKWIAIWSCFAHTLILLHSLVRWLQRYKQATSVFTWLNGALIMVHEDESVGNAFECKS